MKTIKDKKTYVIHKYKSSLFSYIHLRDDIIGCKSCDFCALYGIEVNDSKKDIPYCHELGIKLKNYNACSKFFGESKYDPPDAEPSLVIYG